MSNDNLGDRIKHNYEDAYRTYFPSKIPIIIRLDGCHFSSYTSICDKPFDLKLIEVMNETMIYLCKNIQGVKLAFCQSDEISLLIYNSDFNSQGWFNNNLQKMVSVSAAMASSYFTANSWKIWRPKNDIYPMGTDALDTIKIAQFDARAFLVPLDEVTNAFEFRQQDATRNSVQSVARSLYSHKECNNKNIGILKQMILTKGQDWSKLPISQQRGRCAIKEKYMKDDVERNRWVIDQNIPIFHEDRNYIDQYLLHKVEEATNLKK